MPTVRDRCRPRGRTPLRPLGGFSPSGPIRVRCHSLRHSAGTSIRHRSGLSWASHFPTVERTFGPVTGVASEDPCTWRKQAMARRRPPWMRAIEDVLLPSAANGALLERSAPAAQQHRLPPIERRLTTMGREFVGCASATSSASRTSGRAPTPRPGHGSTVIDGGSPPDVPTHGRHRPPGPAVRVRLTAPRSRSTPGLPDRHLSPDPKAPASVPPNRESSWDNLKS